MNVLSTWGRANDHLDCSITEGVKPYKLEGGHQPWTAEQIAVAREHLTGGLRRGAASISGGAGRRKPARDRGCRSGTNSS